jgi:ribosomal protein L7/L12
MPKCVFCDQENPTDVTNCRLCGGPLPASDSEPLSDEVFQQQLVRLLNEGQRIQAVAAYRRRTGVDLSQAVEVIDALERDHEFNVTSNNADLEWEIIAHLERNEKIGAIKLYREKTNCGLKQAKDAVEAIEARMGLSPLQPQTGGCFGVVVFLCLLATALVVT